MKKIYLSIAIFAMGANLAFGQFAQKKNILDVSKAPSHGVAPDGPVEKALGIAYLISDFSTPGDWVAANDGQTSPFGWNIGSTSNTWWTAFAGGISSTSGGNYAEVYNGNYNNNDQATGVTYTLTTANPIDIQTLTGTDLVSLSFEQYGANFNDLQEFQISLDGTNWTTVGSNADQETYVGNNASAIYGNPMTRTININPYISGNAGSVWIRFSWTSAYPTSSNLAAWTTFGWFIDDVNIVTLPDNDLSATGSEWGSLGLHYYQIPQTQVAPIDFSANVVNDGVDTQTNVQLTAEVNGAGTFNGTSALGISVGAGSTDSLALSTQFTPSAQGTYNFTWSVGSDQVDDVPTNNVLEGESFDVTQYIYARDTDGTPGASGGADNADSASVAFEAGNYFDAFASEQVYAINVTIGANTEAGTVIYGKLYVYDASVEDFVYVDETAEYTTVTGDIGSEKTLSLFTSPTLTEGSTYLAVVGCYSEFYYGTSGFSPDQTSFIMYGGVGGSGSQYYTNNTPMVRMNFDGSVAIAEVSQTGAVLGQNMPNPFDNNSTINFELTNTSDVQFEFVDMTGKIVKTMDLGTLTNGSHSIQVDATEFASGIYYYSLVSEGSKITSKMIVQK